MSSRVSVRCDFGEPVLARLRHARPSRRSLSHAGIALPRDLVKARGRHLHIKWPATREPGFWLFCFDRIAPRSERNPELARTVRGKYRHLTGRARDHEGEVRQRRGSRFPGADRPAVGGADRNYALDPGRDGRGLCIHLAKH